MSRRQVLILIVWRWWCLQFHQSAVVALPLTVSLVRFSSGNCCYLCMYACRVVSVQFMFGIRLDRRAWCILTTNRVVHSREGIYIYMYIILLRNFVFCFIDNFYLLWMYNRSSFYVHYLYYACKNTVRIKIVGYNVIIRVFWNFLWIFERTFIAFLRVFKTETSIFFSYFRFIIRSFNV